MSKKSEAILIGLSYLEATLDEDEEKVNIIRENIDDKELLAAMTSISMIMTVMFAHYHPGAENPREVIKTIRKIALRDDE